MSNQSSIKNQFPIFQKHPDLVYLDSPATTLKPQSVIDSLLSYYTDYTANVHRGIYKSAERSTKEYEETREVVARFIHAKDSKEVVFTKGTTEALNLLVYAWGRKYIQKDDEIAITVMEHHSNFVPWQQLAFELGADLKVIDITDDGLLNIYNSKGEIDLSAIVTSKTKLLSLTYVSNMLGTINPIKQIIDCAKKINPQIVIVVDGAQAVSHFEINVQELGCDFFVFSGHKLMGPTGTGVLWGKYQLLQNMYPFHFGGEMIQDVSLDHTTFKDAPNKFEAGTPHIAGIIALKSAINFVQEVGFNHIQHYEQQLTLLAKNELERNFGSEIIIYGPKDIRDRAGLLSFSFGSYHSHDIAQILDEDDVCVRAGHHCTMPLHKRLNVVASTRASFYIYNTEKDVEKLVNGLEKVRKVLKIK
ncbi:MAG: SufS family cysteine desulfurase [Candidatus Roizmanbacteria bacterium]